MNAEWLSSILPKNYFEIMFRYLWGLSPDLQKEVDEFKQKHFGKFNIGIQIRHPSKNLKVIHLIHTSCLNTSQGKIDHKGFPVPPLELYAHAAEVSEQNLLL